MRVLLLILLCVHFAFAGVGKILALKGDASITRDTKTIPATVGLELENKDQITTDSKTKLQIEFSDGTIIRVGQDTKFDIKDYLYDKTNNSKAEFKVSRGFFNAVSGDIGKVARDNFKLETRTATCGIRGTQFQGLIDPVEEKIACTGGGITVATTAGEVSVGAGEITSFMSGAMPSAPRELTNDDLKSMSKGSARNTQEAKQEKEEKQKQDSKKQEGKSESKSDSKSESKADSKSESKADSKSESKADSKSESKSDNGGQKSGDNGQKGEPQGGGKQPSGDNPPPKAGDNPPPPSGGDNPPPPPSGGDMPPPPPAGVDMSMGDMPPPPPPPMPTMPQVEMPNLASIADVVSTQNADVVSSVVKKEVKKVEDEKKATTPPPTDNTGGTTTPPTTDNTGGTTTPPTTDNTDNTGGGTDTPTTPTLQKLSATSELTTGNNAIDWGYYAYDDVVSYANGTYSYTATQSDGSKQTITTTSIFDVPVEKLHLLQSGNPLLYKDMTNVTPYSSTSTQSSYWIGTGTKEMSLYDAKLLGSMRQNDIVSLISKTQSNIIMLDFRDGTMYSTFNLNGNTFDIFGTKDNQSILTNSSLGGTTTSTIAVDLYGSDKDQIIGGLWLNNTNGSNITSYDSMLIANKSETMTLTPKTMGTSSSGYFEWGYWADGEIIDSSFGDTFVQGAFVNPKTLSQTSTTTLDNIIASASNVVNIVPTLTYNGNIYGTVSRNSFDTITPLSNGTLSLIFNFYAKTFSGSVEMDEGNSYAWDFDLAGTFGSSGFNLNSMTPKGNVALANYKANGAFYGTSIEAVAGGFTLLSTDQAVASGAFEASRQIINNNNNTITLNTVSLNSYSYAGYDLDWGYNPQNATVTSTNGVMSIKDETAYVSSYPYDTNFLDNYTKNTNSKYFDTWIDTSKYSQTNSSIIDGYMSASSEPYWYGSGYKRVSFNDANVIGSTYQNNTTNYVYNGTNIRTILDYSTRIAVSTLSIDLDNNDPTNNYTKMLFYSGIGDSFSNTGYSQNSGVNGFIPTNGASNSAYYSPTNGASSDRILSTIEGTYTNGTDTISIDGRYSSYNNVNYLYPYTITKNGYFDWGFWSGGYENEWSALNNNNTNSYNTKGAFVLPYGLTQSLDSTIQSNIGVSKIANYTGNVYGTVYDLQSSAYNYYTSPYLIKNGIVNLAFDFGTSSLSGDMNFKANSNLYSFTLAGNLDTTGFTISSFNKNANSTEEAKEAQGDGRFYSINGDTSNVDAVAGGFNMMTTTGKMVDGAFGAQQKYQISAKSEATTGYSSNSIDFGYYAKDVTVEHIYATSNYKTIEKDGTIHTSIYDASLLDNYLLTSNYYDTYYDLKGKTQSDMSYQINNNSFYWSNNIGTRYINIYNGNIIGTVYTTSEIPSENVSHMLNADSTISTLVDFGAKSAYSNLNIKYGTTASISSMLYNVFADSFANSSYTQTGTTNTNLLIANNTATYYDDQQVGTLSANTLDDNTINATYVTNQATYTLYSQNVIGSKGYIDWGYWSMHNYGSKGFDDLIARDNNTYGAWVNTYLPNVTSAVLSSYKTNIGQTASYNANVYGTVYNINTNNFSNIYLIKNGTMSLNFDFSDTNAMVANGYIGFMANNLDWAYNIDSANVGYDSNNYLGFVSTNLSSAGINDTPLKEGTISGYLYGNKLQSIAGGINLISDSGLIANGAFGGHNTATAVPISADKEIPTATFASNKIDWGYVLNDVTITPDNTTTSGYILKANGDATSYNSFSAFANAQYGSFNNFYDTNFVDYWYDTSNIGSLSTINQVSPKINYDIWRGYGTRTIGIYSGNILGSSYVNNTDETTTKSLLTTPQKSSFIVDYSTNSMLGNFKYTYASGIGNLTTTINTAQRDLSYGQVAYKNTTIANVDNLNLSYGLYGTNAEQLITQFAYDDMSPINGIDEAHSNGVIASEIIETKILTPQSMGTTTYDIKNDSDTTNDTFYEWGYWADTAPASDTTGDLVLAEAFGAWIKPINGMTVTDYNVINGYINNAVTATYSGNVYGTVHDASNTATLSKIKDGTIDMNINFGTQSLSGTTTFDAVNASNVATKWSSNFTGTVYSTGITMSSFTTNNPTSQVTINNGYGAGQFVGNNAQGIVGGVQISSGTQIANGAFGANMTTMTTPPVNP